MAWSCLQDAGRELIEGLLTYKMWWCAQLGIVLASRHRQRLDIVTENYIEVRKIRSLLVAIDISCIFSADVNVGVDGIGIVKPPPGCIRHSFDRFLSTDVDQSKSRSPSLMRSS